MSKIDQGQKLIGGLGKMLKAEKYVVPHSVNQRNYYDIHKAHRPQFESMLSDTLASGIPEDLLNEIRFFGMNSPNTGGKAMWLPTHNGITLQELEFSNRIADRGDPLKEMQGWLTHELGHATDMAGTPRQISNPRRGALSFIRDERDRMLPQHDVMEEILGLDNLGGTSTLGTHLAYPIMSGFKDDTELASEVLAQLYRGWKGNPDVIMSEAPKTGRLLERAFKGDNVGELRSNIKNQFGFSGGGLAKLAKSNPLEYLKTLFKGDPYARRYELPIMSKSGKPIIIDNTSKGVGSTPSHAESNYFGATVLMTPDQFRIASAPKPIGVNPYVIEAIESGRPISGNQLRLGMVGDKDDALGIISHEGRNRAEYMDALGGSDIMIPVQVFPHGWMRSRHITPEYLRGFFNDGLSERGSKLNLTGPNAAVIDDKFVEFKHGGAVEGRC